ncbi:MAG: hypothetical protein HOV81_05620 [Kofleriaceae bacterium]|nr:hypothetical protein [Kofleriaceae bacterium]
MTPRLLAAALLVTAACGSTSTGDLPGGGFEIEDTISASITRDEDSVAQIVIASTSGLCGDAGATPPIDRAGQQYIVIELADVAGAMTTTPTAPGTYEIYPNTGSRPAKSASLVTGAFDDACESVDDATASGQSGTVTLSSINGDVFAGSYDVVLNTGDRITGQFAPSACPALRAAAASTDAHTCAH